MIFAVDAVLGVIWLWTADTPAAAVPPGVYVWGALVTGPRVIFLVSPLQVVRLGSGGAAVAAWPARAGWRPIRGDPLERRLLNVVEEMAIASGVRVPQVYVMDERERHQRVRRRLDVSGAVVAVTRGALERADARRAAGRDRPRVQPHPERRHARSTSA